MSRVCAAWWGAPHQAGPAGTASDQPWLQRGALSDTGLGLAAQGFVSGGGGSSPPALVRKRADCRTLLLRWEHQSPKFLRDRGEQSCARRHSLEEPSVATSSIPSLQGSSSGDAVAASCTPVLLNLRVLCCVGLWRVHWKSGRYCPGSDKPVMAPAELARAMACWTGSSNLPRPTL